MAVAGFVIMHLIQTAGPSEGHAKPQVTSAAGRGKTRPRPLAGARRCSLGIITENRPLRWLGKVDRTSRATEPMNVLWPGRRYVDAIGFDGQLTGATSSFYTVFGPTLAEVRRFTNVPVMLSEVGVQQGRSRPGKVTSLLTAAREAHITALNLFDVEVWNFDNDRPTLAAIRKAAT